MSKSNDLTNQATKTQESLKDQLQINHEDTEAMEINIPATDILKLQNVNGAHSVNDSGTHYINVGDIIDASHVEVAPSSSSAYLYNQETGDIQLIELNVNEATVIDGNEVEIVTIDTSGIFFTNFQTNSSTLQNVDGNYSLQSQSGSTELLTGPRKSQKSSTNKKSLVPQLKSAPALLRNSRRTQRPEKSSGQTQTTYEKSPKSPRGRTAAQKSKKSLCDSHHNTASRQTVVLLESDPQNNPILGSSEETTRKTPNGEVISSGFYIFQNAGEDQVLELFPDAETNLRQVGNNDFIYKIQNGDTILLNECEPLSSVVPETVKTEKKSKASKKASKKKVPRGSFDATKKPNRGGVTSELKCMEENCQAVAYNVSELRKHLTNFHDIAFDLERKEFSSDLVFKEWRQHYERDRMVSFIYRGGTKKISKDQSVTYMICHRSGHYKPTIADTTKRKRKMKPQGSCKIGGYCTAGIKLLKNVETGMIQADICHTHYGHPLDSEAIPHLRVNPVLKRLIVKKFEEGMNFAEMLAYIHHNPDGLEGLRVVDRRAVRNIYDTWRKSTASNYELQLKEDIKDNSNELEIDDKTEDINNDVPSSFSSSILDDRILKTTSEERNPNAQADTATVDQSHPILKGRENNSSISKSNPPNPVNKNKKDMTQSHSSDGQYTVNLQEVAVSEEHGDDNSPMQITIESVKSLKPYKKRKECSHQSSKRKGEPIIVKTESMAEHCSSKILRSQPSRRDDVMTSRAANDGRSTPASSETSLVSKKDIHFKAKGNVEIQEGKVGKNMSSLRTSNNPSQNEDNDEEYFDSLQICISPELEAAIDKLHNHGEAGPSILLYKRLGETNTKYGGFCRAFREDDFCLIIQTPVQRQIFQLFPKIVSLEILDSPKPSEHGLKLAFISVLDDFREAMPVAWMIADSMCPRFLNQFFRMLRYHCGELPVRFIMAPRNIDVLKPWSAYFGQKPKILQNEFSVKRDLRTLLNRHFPNDEVRSSAWDIVEKLVHEKYSDNLKLHRANLEKISKRTANGNTYLRKMEKDWFPRIKEWSFAYRVGISASLLFVEDCFIKLRKFVSFKGTKRLNQSIDNILKIGYDKCFLRTKRMFKGDQKLSKMLEKLDEFHNFAVTSLKNVVVKELIGRHAWKVLLDDGEKEEEVFYLQSPCDCKIRCKVCTICIHEYICTCKDFQNLQTMCAHIHKVHCTKNGISLEAEASPVSRLLPQSETTNYGKSGTVDAEGDINSESAGVTIINENEIEDLNISDVLGLLGQQTDGQELPKIVSITDVSTQKVIYDSSNTSPLAVFQLDSD